MYLIIAVLAVVFDMVAYVLLVPHIMPSPLRARSYNSPIPLPRYGMKLPYWVVKLDGIPSMKLVKHQEDK